MIGSFRFGHFKNKILITNDAGEFFFLSQQDFNNLLHDEKTISSDLQCKLQKSFFHYDGAKETYLRDMQESVRQNHAYLFVPTSLFIFALTNRCNNSCIYCQAHGCKNIADMSSNVARKIIDRISYSPAEHINIEFQGGEPLYSFRIIKEIVEYSKKTLTKKQIDFSLVTNLALMTEEIADYIAENKISVSTSLDGPQKLHDLNRPTIQHTSSFDLLIKGLELLRKRGIIPGAIQTTTRYSLPFAREIVKTYSSMGFRSIFLRPLTRLGAAAQAWNEIGYTPEEFLAFYQEALDEILLLNQRNTFLAETHASIFLTKLFGGTAQNYMELRSPCGAGLGQIAFTANGDVFTCDEGRMLAEMGDNTFRLGNVFENDYSAWIDNPICKAVSSSSCLETIPTCCDCVYQPYCGVCPVANYALERSLIAKTPNNDRCRIYKGILEILLNYFYEGNDCAIEVFRKWIDV